MISGKYCNIVRFANVIQKLEVSVFWLQHRRFITKNSAAQERGGIMRITVILNMQVSMIIRQIYLRGSILFLMEWHIIPM